MKPITDEERESKPEGAPDEGRDRDVLVSIEWYAPGETRLFEIDGVVIRVRFVGRQGRRGRLAIFASAHRATGESDEGRPDAAMC